MLEQALELADFRPDSSGRLTAGPGKYEGLRPFDVWLAEQVIGDDSWSDEQTGDATDFGAWVARVGRRCVMVVDVGFVSVVKYATETEARDAFALVDAAYSEWSSEEETEEETDDVRDTPQYRHARYVRDADEATALAFADFVADHFHELFDTDARDRGESPYDALWSAFVRERTPRSGDGHRE